MAAMLMMTLPVTGADIGSVVNNSPEPNVANLSVNELAQLMATPNAHLHIYDANPPKVRENDGMIPGARPLSSADRYNVAAELPTNKRAKLVFYCYDTR